MRGRRRRGVREDDARRRLDRQHADPIDEWIIPATAIASTPRSRKFSRFANPGSESIIGGSLRRRNLSCQIPVNVVPSSPHPDEGTRPIGFIGSTGRGSHVSSRRRFRTRGFPMNRGSDAPVPKPPRRAVCGNDPTGAPGGVPPDPIDGLRASAPTIGNAEGTAIVAHRRGGGADRASRRGVGFLPRGVRVGVGIRHSRWMRRPGRTPGPRARPGRARPSAPPRRTRRRSARSQRGAPSPRRRPPRPPPPVARPPNPVRTPESKNPPRRAPPRRPRDSLSARNRPRGRTCTARAPHPSTSRPDEARARRPIAPPARRTPVRFHLGRLDDDHDARATPTSAEVPTCGRGGGGVHRRHRRRHHREGRRRESREGGGRGRVGVGIVEIVGNVDDRASPLDRGADAVSERRRRDASSTPSRRGHRGRASFVHAVRSRRGGRRVRGAEGVDRRA